MATDGCNTGLLLLRAAVAAAGAAPPCRLAKPTERLKQKLAAFQQRMVSSVYGLFASIYASLS